MGCCAVEEVVRVNAFHFPQANFNCALVGGRDRRRLRSISTLCSSLLVYRAGIVRLVGESPVRVREERAVCAQAAALNLLVSFEGDRDSKLMTSLGHQSHDEAAAGAGVT